MADGVLRPEEVGPADAARVLDFLNRVADAPALAETIGFSEGPSVGLRVAEAILQRRAAGLRFGTLAELSAVTGVNLARFTEIVIALSGARPAAAGLTVRLMPSATRPWLGQKVLIAAQLLDSNGFGVPGAEISCVASSGILSAPSSRGEIQRGAAIRLTTEPAGIVNLELHPRLNSPPEPDAAAALEAELARLGTEDDGPLDVAPALAAFAARYRADASSALREAVDRLFAAYPVDTAGVGALWPVEPVTLMAIVDGGDGRPALAGTTTLFIRNWLGAWLAELTDAMRSDRRLDEALSKLEIGDSDTDAAHSLFVATQAFAQLERGVVGGRQRDKLAGQAAVRLLERLGGDVKPATLENMVRAAGASNAAIATGGFAVFDAIQSVQNVSDAVGPTRGIDVGKLGVFDGRLAQLETKAIDKATLDTVRADILQQTDLKVGIFGGRVSTLEADRVTKAQLSALGTGLTTAINEVRAAADTSIGKARTDLSARIDGKADQTAVANLNQTFRALADGRLAQLEARVIDKAAVDALKEEILRQTDVKVADLRGRITTFETDRITKAQLTALESRLTQLGGRIDAKADQATVNALQTENRRFSSQLEGVDFDVLRRNRPIGPNR
jgi:hypothetical protein